MVKIIGLTGGIGSGKTTVARQFEQLGIPVYIADDEAKKVMQSKEAIAALKNVFGLDVFSAGVPDRKKLADIVFSNPQKLEELNKIIHPLVKKDFDQWVMEKSHFPFVIKEAAILFESGSYKDCDIIITVSAPLELRIERVMRRDNTDYESVLSRINNQWTDEMRFAKSDFIIENIDAENTKNQIAKVFKELTIR